MDLEEWEFIPDDGFLEIHHDGKNKIFSRKYVKNSPKSIVNMNYFICPSQKPPKFVESTEDSRVPNQLVPLPIHLQQNIQKSPDYELVKEIDIAPSEFTEKSKAENYIGEQGETEQDSVSQIFFKKMKENEFEMKMDSPKSTSKGILPQIEPRSIKEEDDMVAWEESNDDGSVNMWKWSLTGIGAICSFGVAAAATICIIVLGPKNRQYQQNHQKLRFQIHADDKRMKEVVQQQAS